MRKAALYLITFFLLPGVVQAIDAGAIPFREMQPQGTRQRGLDEIQELPSEDVGCPVCGFMVSVPQVDRLMLKSTADESGRTKWRMDARVRDTDFCPYPPSGKVYWQADVVLCPDCGYAAEAGAFSEVVTEEARAWVLSNLRPSLREAQAGLLGWRKGEMTDGQVAVFFNHQGEIPDAIRLEHWVTCLDGMHAPVLERAKARWLSAWAFRRRLLETPRSEVFARHAPALQKELSLARPAATGLHGDVDALRALLRRKRQGRQDLPGAVDMTGRLILAGLWDRHGFLGEAEKVLTDLYAECHERFLRPEQDPLWQETSQRASRTHRLNELELMRADAEGEVRMHLELVRGEKERLRASADLIRQAMGEGAFDGDRSRALFYSYLVGEFLRRAGNLPLATEWLKQLISLEGEGTPMGKLAAEQLECVREEAGDRVNLLSALGQDGELFARLREIYKLSPEAEKDK